MAFDQIVCFGDNPFTAAETYVLDIGHIAAYTILPIGGINICANFTIVQAALESLCPIQPA
jgi:hypothetical protein